MLCRCSVAMVMSMSIWLSVTCVTLRSCRSTKVRMRSSVLLSCGCFVRFKLMLFKWLLG